MKFKRNKISAHQYWDCPSGSSDKDNANMSQVYDLLLGGGG